MIQRACSDPRRRGVLPLPADNDVFRGSNPGAIAFHAGTLRPDLLAVWWGDRSVALPLGRVSRWAGGRHFAHRARGEVPGVAGPGDEIAAGAGGRGRLRASHADREQVIGILKAAFVHGRLDRDEFDLRVGRALASRTYADLAALTADIPARLARARLPEPTRESVNKKAVAAMAGATAAFIGIWLVMILTQDGSPFAVP